MSFADVLAIVIEHLDGAGIPYMITGSLASSYHGEPRSTRDVDVVIDPSRSSLTRLVEELTAAGFYVDAGAADAALEDRSPFNAISPDATKVDFIVRLDRPFSIEEFNRRQPAELLGTPGFVVTAEDLVIAKLEWAAGSGSERQLEDVAGVVAISAGLDLPYIDRWARILGLELAWGRLRPR